MKEVCQQLKEALKNKPFFDVVGGCGVDLSGGTSNCMDASGSWFKFCPFCGSKIVSACVQGKGWNWKEEPRTATVN